MEKFGSSAAGKKGAKARIASTTPEQRTAQAQKAAMTRWGDKLPKATHGSPEKPLRLGDGVGEIEIECYVLEDKTRVITQATFLESLGRHRKANVRKEQNEAEEQLPAILQGKAINPYIPKDLVSKSRPIKFVTPDGSIANGYRAELLPAVCEVYLKARDKDELPTNQKHVGERAYMLMRELAHVGIIALVDEATGFQYDRPRRDLEEQLKKFLSESLRRWVRTFPTDYFKHLCRLRQVDLRPDMKLPQYFGILTNNLIYRRIAPGLLKKLKERRLEIGRPKEKLHSGLSLDMGVPEVLLHLGMVVGLMKLHDNYESFEKQLDQIAPIYPETPGLFDDPKDWEPR